MHRYEFSQHTDTLYVNGKWEKKVFHWLVISYVYGYVCLFLKAVAKVYICS